MGNGRGAFHPVSKLWCISESPVRTETYSRLVMPRSLSDCVIFFLHCFALLLCEKRRASPGRRHALQPSSGPHAKRLIGSAAASIDRLLSKPRAWDLVLLLSSRWEALLKANELFLAQAALCKAGNSHFNTQILGNRSVQLKKPHPLLLPVPCGVRQY